MSVQLDWIAERQERTEAASQRLAAMVERNLSSYENRRYRERRAAALKARGRA